jgi:kinesin family protein C2/C3
MIQHQVGPKMFSFDKVFAEDVSQEGVYEDMQPLMRCVLDGLNVALLAYGQTGSGKTFTMSGPGNAEDAHQRGALSGVNYRALEDLFAIAQQRDGEIEYTFTVQMLEIYNEQVGGWTRGRRPMRCRNTGGGLRRLGMWRSDGSRQKGLAGRRR